MKSIRQSFSVKFTYDVVFTRDLFSKENTVLLDILTSDSSEGPKKVAIVIDQGVVDHHSDLIEKITEYFSINSDIIKLTGTPLVMPGGEEVKNDYENVDTILHQINDEKIDRHAYMICIGGGALLDMVGFAASIGHRGIRHIRIPTTVLSQNDSAVGVKNGVNFLGKKNFIGNFEPPFAVLNDANFLTTLNDRDWRSGVSEAFKVALIKDKTFYEWLENNVTQLANRDLDTMEILVERCAKMHLDHIANSGDPFEKGSSRPLDFGHWSAHKLEQLSNFEIKHGEAVAIGICLDVAYSLLKGMLSETDYKRIVSCFVLLGFDLQNKHLFSEDGKSINAALLKGLEEFREHLGGKLTIMLLEDIGIGVEVHEMDNDLLSKAALLLKDTIDNYEYQK